MYGNIPGTSRRNIKYFYRYLCCGILIAVSTILFFRTWYGFVIHHNITGYLLGYGNLGMATGIYLLLYTSLCRWLRAFKVGVERVSNIIVGQILGVFLTALFEMFISCAITNQFRFFPEFLGMYFLLFLEQAIVNSILVIMMVHIYRRIFPPLKVLEIYGNPRNDLSEKVGALKYKYKVTESISVNQGEKILRRKFQSFDAILLNDLSSHERNSLLKLCFELNKRVYFIPKLSDVLIKNSDELNLIDAPLFLNKNNGIGPLQRFCKRSFDIFFSLLILITLSPLMLITALAIHLEDGGTVFFRQERVTIGGKRFMIWKFRSMIMDAEKDGRPHPAEEKDDRITKVGRIIRAVRIDELPQLFNILKGEMSVVGPRPERCEHVEKYTAEIPQFVYRNKMKGGLTGYAQVYGKYNTTALDKLKLDLLYITNYSLLLDIQIIFETIKILFVRSSTEGFAAKQVLDKTMQ